MEHTIAKSPMKICTVLSQLYFPVLIFNSEDAYHAGKFDRNLQKQGVPVGGYNVLIAGQVIAQNLILTDYNVKEFRKFIN